MLPNFSKIWVSPQHVISVLVWMWQRSTDLVTPHSYNWFNSKLFFNYTMSRYEYADYVICVSSCCVQFKFDIDGKQSMMMKDRIVFSYRWLIRDYHTSHQQENQSDIGVCYRCSSKNNTTLYADLLDWEPTSW